MQWPVGYRGEADVATSLNGLVRSPAAFLTDAIDELGQNDLGKLLHDALQFFGISSSDRIKVMNRKIRKDVASGGIIAIAIWFGGLGIAVSQDALRSSSTGVFSEEQAKKGNVAYNANCASCHGSDLISTDREFPSLTGGSFKFAWVGKTIGEKFDFIRNSMPPKEERSLGDQVYLDIVAYILRFNKVPAGSQTLKPDLEILNHIVIAAPST